MAIVCVVAAVANSVESAHGTSGKDRCGAGQVAVSVGGRASCQPTRTVLPKPKAADSTLAVLRDALGDSPFGRFGASGKQAQARIMAALPHVLRLVQAHTKRRLAGAARAATVAAQQARCESGPQLVSTSYNGLQFGGGDGFGFAQVTIGDRTFRFSWEECGSDALSVPTCPSANGDVRASSGSKTTNIAQEIWQGGVGSQLLVRRSDSWISGATAAGKVADDARLDHVDFAYSLERFVLDTTSGQAPVVQRGTEVRRVRINMRSGAYDLANSTVGIQGDASPFAGAANAGSFADAAARAIKSFRSAEAGWNSFQSGKGGFCATAVFTPSSNTLRVKPGDSGDLGMYVKAREGGRATGARWTLISPANASFSPSTVRTPSPQVTYRVVGSPSGNQVQVTATFTSTAGVGKDTWTQPLEALPMRFEGTFSGDTQAANTGIDSEPPATDTFSGKVTFVRDEARSKDNVWVYSAESVDFVDTVSSTGFCRVDAMAHVSLGKGPDLEGELVLEPTGKGYRYTISATAQDTQPMQINATCNGERTTVSWTPVAVVQTGGDVYAPDVRELTGTSSSDTYKSSWDLKGS